MACVTCNILTGFEAGCSRTPAGGLVEIYIAQTCDIDLDAITRDGYNNESGIVTGIPLEPGSTWKRAVARVQTVNYNDTVVEGSNTFVQQLQFLIEPSGQGVTKEESRQATLDFVRALVQSTVGLVVIFAESNRVRRVMGLASGAFATAATIYDSGTARTDIPGQTIQLQAVDTEQAPVLDPAYVIVV